MGELMTTKELITAVKNGDPVDLNDYELIELAVCATSELKQRLPIYAIKQGDLPESYGEAAVFRSHLAHTLEDAVRDGVLFPPKEEV